MSFYDIAITGAITLDQPIPLADLPVGCAYLRDNHRSPVLPATDVILRVTPDATVDAIVPADDLDMKRGNLTTQLRQILHLCGPDRRFAGMLLCHGQDGQQWSLHIHDGRVIEHRQHHNTDSGSSTR